MLASGICGTDKHTFRGETEQYAGTDHARTTPLPDHPGARERRRRRGGRAGGARAWDGSELAPGDRVVPAPNRPCGCCRFCTGDFPYYLCERLENYGNSLTAAEPPHLFGGWASCSTCGRGRRSSGCPTSCPTEVAVLTELMSVTHSLDLAARLPRPGGFRSGDTVAVVGVGPLGLVHVVKASLLGAGRVVAIDPLPSRLDARPGARRGRGRRTRRAATARRRRRRRRERASRLVPALARAPPRRRHPRRGRRLRLARAEAVRPRRALRPQPDAARRRRRGRAGLRAHSSAAGAASRLAPARARDHAPLPARAGGRGDGRPRSAPTAR